jgi:hypothetical protein
MAESGSPAPVELLLKSKDGEIFKVEKSIAMQINFVKGMLEGSCEVSHFLIRCSILCFRVRTFGAAKGVTGPCLLVLS